MSEKQRLERERKAADRLIEIASGSECPADVKEALEILSVISESCIDEVYQGEVSPAAEVALELHRMTRRDVDYYEDLALQHQQAAEHYEAEAEELSQHLQERELAIKGIVAGSEPAKEKVQALKDVYC